MPTENITHVFINCPFDSEYAPLFDAMVFAVYKCNFLPRCAKEVDDSSENRLDKIVRIIDESRLGIHDISRTELDEKTGLPRFNMPFELGLFLGARKLGGRKHRLKTGLVLDREPYRYQSFISDLAGQDIKAHQNNPRTLIIAVRDWLNAVRSDIPSGSLIWDEYEEFQSTLPELCQELNLVEGELTFVDYTRLIYGWLERHEESG